MSCRRQLLVKLARIAAVLPPRGLPTNREFLRWSTTRFISRSLTLLTMGTAPSEVNTVSASHWLSVYSQRQPWDVSAATVPSRAAASDAAPLAWEPTVSVVTPVAQSRKRLSLVFPRQTVRRSDRPPGARSPAPISPLPR